MLIDQIREVQGYDPKLMKIKSEVEQRLRTDFLVWSDEALVLDARL